MRRAHVPLALGILALLAALAGCGGGGGPTTTTAPPTTRSARTRSVDLFFLDAQGRRMVTERREVRVAGSPLSDALTALAAGPRTSEAVPALPDDARILGARIDGGTARVDLDRAFVDAYPPGGAEAEIAVLAPIVYTATAIPGVTRVVLRVDGRPPDVPSQFDLGRPLTRRDFPLGTAGP
jgi:spore germination protein GerM